MKHIFVIEQEESEQPLINLASAIAQFDPDKNKLRLAFVFETDSDDIAKIMAKNISPITQNNSNAPAVNKSAPNKHSKTSGICVQCGREALLVKENNLCKPCHMAKLREAKKNQPGERKFEKRESTISDKEARLQANIDRVVANAQAKGEDGRVVVPLAVKSFGHARKVG